MCDARKGLLHIAAFSVASGIRRSSKEGDKKFSLFRSLFKSSFAFMPATICCPSRPTVGRIMFSVVATAVRRPYLLRSGYYNF